MLLCRFSGGTQKLTGSALLTSPASISRLTAAINAATATSEETCGGDNRVVILLGHGHNVTALGMSIHDCFTLLSGDTVATYRHTPLLRLVTADLSAH